MNRPVTTRDIETRSVVNLKKAGVYRYAEHPSTEILCDVSQGGDGSFILAHNAAFERVMLNAKKGLNLKPEGMDCTMARALACGLPASLEACGAALGAPVQKDKDGHRLMLKMCKPRSIDDAGNITWWDDLGDRNALLAYCDRDVEAEIALDLRLPRLSERERRVWLLDQTINDRGVAVDVPLVQAALGAVAEAKRRADRRIGQLTSSAVTKCSQSAKIVAWINSRGIPCKSIAKGETEALVFTAGVFDDPLVEEVVALRRRTTKMFRFDKILAQVCRDGRLHGVFSYHKAHTGRWAGWTQSFPRVDSPAAVSDALGVLSGPGSASAHVDTLELLCDNPLETLSECLRPVVVAGPGRTLYGGDFANIEGRVAAWFAGEMWKLQAFRDYDAGTGPDLYYVMASEVLQIDPEDVDRLHRQSHGKVPELACGYQGAILAFQKMAHTQDPPVRVSDTEARRIVTLWRDKNSSIVQSWWDLQDAAIAAVDTKGCIVSVLNDQVRYVSDGKFLYCRLPSGRTIHYASPTVRWKTRIITVDDEEIEINSRGVTFWGVGFNSKWEAIDLYGGMQFNHVVQGLARDLLVEAMFRVEDAGYRIVHHTHDDLISERKIGEGSVDEYERLMAQLPDWAEGLPVTVKAWEGPRWDK